MGSERVFRELEAGKESERVSVNKKKSPVPRDGMGDVNDARGGSWGYSFSSSYIRQESRSHNVKVENVTVQTNFIKGSPVRLVSPRSDDFQVSRKCKKLSKNGSGCSKRLRLTLLEDSQRGDKCQILKQRANCGGKRSDKRTAKISTRTKYDSFSPKNGMALFNSSSGGHNVLGYYGLKPDLHDITKQVNELSLTEHSLEELLDDTSPCQGTKKAKGINTLDTNEKITESIKNACSILVPLMPSKIQASSELEESRSCPESPTNTVDLPLYHPSVVLERLGLQPSEDLDSLLSGDARPALSVRDGFDSRLGKRLVSQSYLPAFSWSHNFGGHCKTTSDALKLSTSRSPCQGSRWAKIGHIASFCGVLSNNLTDFSKISFNPNLVPQREFVSVNITCGEPGHFPDTAIAASDTRTASITTDENPPSLTAAAQTLCHLATQSLPSGLIRILRRPRKPQDKVLEAKKLKSENRTERSFSRPKSLLGYDSMSRQSDHLIHAKKMKLTSIDKKKDVTLAKGPLIWAGPKSCRSSSHRLIKDTRSDNRYPSSELSKPSIGLPPVRILDKGSNSHQKPRKAIHVYWDR